MKSRSPFAISVLQQDAEGASTTGAQHHHAVNQGKRRGQRKLISWFLADRITELIPSWLGRHFSVREVENQGWSNHTFLVEQGSKDKLIIRLRERRKDNSCALAGYYKEIWAVRQMQGLIPVPGIIESGAGSFGHETEYAYMIQEYLPYPSAAGLFGSHKRIAILEQLGRIARVINSTSTAGFGRTFIPQQQQFLNQSWENFMDCELVSCNFRRLRDKSILGPQVLEHLQARLLEARSWKVRPSLYHLDFLANWNNVLIDGPVCAIQGRAFSQ
ncbi:MAG: hypothetical protein DCC75_13755 [Proteobacteria bacterium]|nr:MAG: hypothetical protein DCC75_13755 [Pseudomonadota bacterium]